MMTASRAKTTAEKRTLTLALTRHQNGELGKHGQSVCQGGEGVAGSPLPTDRNEGPEKARRRCRPLPRKQMTGTLRLMLNKPGRY